MNAPSAAAIIWERGPVRGNVEVTYGSLAALRVAPGTGESTGNSFSLVASGPCRLIVECGETRAGHGGRATRISVRATSGPFTFFLRNVSSDHPILLPKLGVAVIPAGDSRSYVEVARAVRDRGLLSEFQRIESEPEETFENAARSVRDLKCQTWLGLSRDFRIFEIDALRTDGCWGWIRPRWHGREVQIPETEKEGTLLYRFILGRGAGCEADLARRLEDGCLPILHGRARDGDILYRFVAFATLERTALGPDTLRGTHFLVADGHAGGHMFTASQQAEFDQLLASERDRDEEVVLHLRASATNTARVPRYAWFRAPSLDGHRGMQHTEDGFGLLASGRVFAVSRMNGGPMQELEQALLVQPGESAVFEFAIPHRPISRDRAEALAQADFDIRLARCRAFWKDKLARAARVEVPEPRVDEMVRAGLLHLDLVAYGLEPGGALAPTIGVYAPIGTESAPIVLFFDAMGRHDLARRSIQYFLDKQHDDGFIQNFGSYMVETGAALFQIGEHFRFTRDLDWARNVAPKATKACDYLLAWRRRNLREDLCGRGYGMLDGKVADPEDPFHYFMNSGYAFLGLKRTAEWLAAIDPARAQGIGREAEALRVDIRAALEECAARSPVIPLGDGTWCPTVPPWAEATGPQALFADGGRCFTHRAFTARDSLLGPLWLVFQEVVEPGEPLGDILLQSHAALFTVRNVAFCQPYYSRHEYAHLRRGEVRAFLKTYYNTVAALADRETYTFWEHYFHASPHKTHEEGWFLMQTRWMLVLEDGETLHLLRGVPRAWLGHGQRIVLENLASHFGPLSLRVESRTDQQEIEARYTFDAERRPQQLLLRLPHPEGLRARSATGGRYLADAESVEVSRPGREGCVQLRF
ncbi:MAG: hypothetical protein HYU36_19675 [Planctomycetes bacterium]|nr:hypothetical protein [Planctomycetota bacterium]